MIVIDLNKLDREHYFEKEERIINNYMSNENIFDIENKLINVLIDIEFDMLITEEGFLSYTMNETSYRKITKEEFKSLQKKEKELLKLQSHKNCYVNFDFTNNNYINSKLGENYLDENMPCLVHFDKNVISFFLLNDNYHHVLPHYIK